MALKVRHRRISPHAPSVGTTISIKDGFVVLRGDHRLDGVAIAERQHGHLLADHELFDDHPCSGCPEYFVLHCGGQRSFGFVKALSDRHSLACGQTIGFNHDGNTLLPDVLEGFFVIIEFSVTSSGDAAFCHQRLGEGFTAL